ncbi:Serine/threonine-protein kinase PknD [Cupriavidus pinatubonensis]|uniref:Serine/threonine-protein kinase PknD n=2 Tax=Cupriavidus pinatubonensis TaxID=248026 RepID=A0ABM8WSB2_9BURK|nr:Serine/threonine-protein kinase PknD [Cupriavidus pinatubonensis]
MISPDRYVLVEEGVGGGMGDIYHCMDTHLNRRVVLKVLKDGGEDRRLLDEQKSLVKLRSKHVVQLFDLATITQDREKSALVLEFISGKNLGVGDYTPGYDYLMVLWQIACGLSDIHASNIIHRDIKPQNIRVDDGGVVKIIDFGLSRDSETDAHTRSIIGTAIYMAPELWGSPVISFDKSIDVYAFGVTALALLKAPPPAAILERPPKSVDKGALAALEKTLPSDVVTLLEACLSYRAADRPPIGEVEALLRKHLLHDKHRALLVMGGKNYELSATSRRVTLTYGTIGTMVVGYDGFRFFVEALSGIVSVNNNSIAVGAELPNCCVITFGTAPVRSFVTFDVSNPEVMA